MHVAYLLAQHPYASCTFIRREIEELERLGVRISRLAIRPTDHELVDAEDRAEVERTRYVLGRGRLGRLLWNTLAVAATRPVRFARALRLALRCSHRSDRSIVVHLAYLMEACVVLRWCRELEVGHVHSHFATNATEVAMLARALGGPSYSFTVHGPLDFDGARVLSLDEKIARSEFVVAISSFARSQIYRWCPHDQWGKVHIVHCGVSRAFLGAPRVPVPAAPRLVSVGRLSEQKGQLLLVEAAARLRSEGIPFELAIVGEGEMREELERLIAERGLGENVHLLGLRSGAEVLAELQRSRALVLSSLAEGLPVVIMEALVLGRPVVSSHIAGIPELVEPGVSGWLVPAGSVVALAQAMRDVLAAEPERLDQMGRAGAVAVAERHDAAREARRLAVHLGCVSQGTQSADLGRENGDADQSGARPPMFRS